MDGIPQIGLYARISLDRDGDQTATSRQLEDCRAFVQRKGWEIAAEFEDVDVRAYQPNVIRPEFERLITALRNGELDGVAAWKLDRISRQQRDLVRLMDACVANRAFVLSVTEGINTAEPAGQFLAELLVSQARMESANSSARQRRKVKEQKEKGVPPTGRKRCFGYTKDYSAVVPEEAALLVDAKDRLLAGESQRSICYEWQAKGVTTTEGNAWQTVWLRRLLMSATIAGHREHEGELHPGTWPAIISVEDLRRLRSLFGSRSAGPRAARKYVLSGMVRCGQCDERMVARPNGHHRRRYVCPSGPGKPGCGKVSITAEPLEELVAAMLFVAVDDVALSEAVKERGVRGDELLDVVLEDERSLEALARDFYGERLLSREEFLAARRVLTGRLETNRAKLARRQGKNVLAEVVGQGSVLRTAWTEGSLEWRRSVAGALLD